MNCPGCGAPLRPEAQAARVTCAHCGTVSEMATEGAMKVARVLEKHGLRMPEKPMSISEIEDEIRERDAVATMQRQTATIMAAVIVALLGGIGVVATLFTR